ncbi:cell division protein SepF [Neobacillus niacini]|jgi:cell division inhibitor SepF|uniref:cell division protein SepF n=1 Tax=Neobacillus niacini TaxID=86668 RepID=UPI001C8D3159|nr:cell division protein SepF [Neobacillus niacini]MBY0144557.1 cell division protein SepF [Neobacillus niacini]
MTIKSKLKTFFFLDDDYDDNNQDEYEKVEPIKPQQKQPSKPQNVVSLQSVQKGAKVILVEPRVYAEAQDITDHLKNRRAVVVNLQRIDHEEGRQIVDFLSGAVYALGGDIQKIGSSIFLCTPDNVEISGNISELVKEQEYHDTRW